jgi:serine/threonine protein kinase
MRYLTDTSAVDLIDSMLVVDPEKRFTIDQCIEHPWMLGADAAEAALYQRNIRDGKAVGGSIQRLRLGGKRKKPQTMSPVAELFGGATAEDEEASDPNFEYT